MKKSPQYVLQEFLKACKEGTQKVYVQKKWALDTAREQLQLLSEDEILKFVANFGIDGFSHCATGIVEKTTDRPPPEFDAYQFSHGFKVYYLAFFKSPSKDRWVLKSLHRDDFKNMENKPFAELIKLKGHFKIKKDGR